MDYKHFNSHPHEEDDMGAVIRSHGRKNISTHILTKRMTVPHCSVRWFGTTFQLTSSRRGWPGRRPDRRSDRYFNSHPHEEDDTDRSDMSWIRQISTHILTKRMTHPSSIQQVPYIHFNSPPHEEDDAKQHCWTVECNISTHILTKRMTNCGKCTASVHGISTHILTKRMTYICAPVRYAPIYFNSHPHEEDDTTVSVASSSYCSFQLTSSRRGWLT